MTERALLAKWRDAVRDSDLDATARIVGMTISTYWRANGNGAYPSKSTIAKGAGLRSVRAVDYAILRLEAAGFLEVTRSKGHRANSYAATLPTPHDDAGLPRMTVQGLDGENPASDDTEPRMGMHSTPHGDAGESGKAKAKNLNASARLRARGHKTSADASDYRQYDCA